MAKDSGGTDTKGNTGAGKDKEPKQITIIINGQQRTIDKKERLTYEEVVSWAYPTQQTGENIFFTVAYRRGENGEAGTLYASESVKAKDGMIFNVTLTDKS